MSSRKTSWMPFRGSALRLKPPVICKRQSNRKSSSRRRSSKSNLLVPRSSMSRPIIRRWFMERGLIRPTRPIPGIRPGTRLAPPCLPLGQALRSALPGDSRGAAPTGAAGRLMSTSTETPILIQTLIASRPSRISKRAGREKGAPSSMTRAIERASVTETTRLLRSSTGAAMPKQPRRAKIFAVGRKAAGKNWRVRAVPATAVVWARKAVLEIEVV